MHILYFTELSKIFATGVVEDIAVPAGIKMRREAVAKTNTNQRLNMPLGSLDLNQELPLSIQIQENLSPENYWHSVFVGVVFALNVRIATTKCCTLLLYLCWHKHFQSHVKNLSKTLIQKISELFASTTSHSYVRMRRKDVPWKFSAIKRVLFDRN